jgi:hypothetical protein
MIAGSALNTSQVSQTSIMARAVNNKVNGVAEELKVDLRATAEWVGKHNHTESQHINLQHAMYNRAKKENI